jgi:hypothetical protein
MCIAILKPEGKILSKDTLRTCFDNNLDGCGFMFAKDSELIMEKGFFKFNEFWNAYNSNMRKYREPISIVHFRIATHGPINKFNCHPFLIDKKVGFAHNGMINFTNPHLKKSDTAVFNNEVLKTLPEGFLFNDGIFTLIEESIGSSKLIFLNSDGRYRIANKDLGTEKDGIWFSNGSYCEYESFPGNSLTSVSVLSKSPYGNFYSGYAKKKFGYSYTYNHCEECGCYLTTRKEKSRGTCPPCAKLYDGSKRDS